MLEGLFVLTVLFLIVIGVWGLVSPRSAIRFERSLRGWQYKDRKVPEPSDAMVVVTRVVGFVSIFFAIIAAAQLYG
ncbi:DUF6199 family natural product biosynthesis protein [Georgenia alba]|uniref:DUF6199 family natural product biosynthesis protein n=1 Tax=Georgenia alba TaxID=2233858 RepID=A0ABW2Q258_9MICO